MSTTTALQKKYLYKITNNINGKIYIGQTVHPEKRWWEHRRRAITHHDNYPIHLAIAKYGEENFSFEVLEESENYDQREQQLIQEYNSLSPNGYNVALGGPAPVFYGENHPRNTVTEEQVTQIIQALQNNEITDRQIAKKYNTTDKIVSDINHGYSHKKQNLNYPLRHKRGSQKITEEQMLEIKELLRNTTLSYQEIANKYGVTKTNIYQINAGRSFRREGDTYPIRSKQWKLKES